MKLTTFGAAIAAAVLTVGLASTAAAQTPTPAPPTCAEALRAYNQAERAYKAAVDADDAVVAAVKADADLTLAVEALVKVKVAPATGNLVNDADLSVADVQGEIAKLAAIATPTADQVSELAADRALLAALQAQVAAKEKAEATNATNLKIEADKTDAAALKTVRDNAKTAADKACTGPSGSPAPPTDLDCPDFATRAAAQVELDKNKSDPHLLDADKDGQACEEFFTATPAPPSVTQNNVTVNPPQFVRVPNTSGGVATGDGSLA